MKKYLIIVILIIGIIALMVWFRPETTPTNPGDEANQEIEAFNAELNAVDLVDLETEFQTIDQEIGAL